VPRERGERRRRDQLDSEAALAADAPERRREARVARVLGRERERAVTVVVADRDRQHVPARVDDRLQERAVEAEHRRAVGRRPLGEHRDHVAGRERVGRAPVDAVRVLTPLALDEQRAGVADQPADDRPARELGLADEARRAVRVQHDDVEPRDVVRDEEDVSVVRVDRAVDARLDVHQREEPARPAPDQRAPALGADAREEERRRRDAGGDVRAHARDAPGPHRQADRPRSIGRLRRAPLSA